MKPIAHNPDAERSVLGAILLRGGEVLDRVDLEPADFFDPRHKAVFGAMRAVHRAMKPIDPVVLAGELGEEKFEAIGGYPLLADLGSLVPTADNVEFYVALVAEAALTRNIRLKLSEALSSGAEGEELLQRVQADVSALGSKLGSGAVSMRDLSVTTYQDVMRAVDRKNAGEDVSLGLATKFTDLDDILGGLQPGVVTILGGRPSMGKSALAREIADNVSAAGDGVHSFSMEDVKRTFALRALADHGRVDLQRLRTLNLLEGDAAKLAGAADELYRRSNWLIDDVAGLSAAQIAMRVRRHKAEIKTRLVVVDYVQLMSEPGVMRGDTQRIIAVSMLGLVELARQDNLAVLVLSQLNRELEKRDNKRPILSDLRHAGELEQHAEVVLFVYRDEYYNKNSPDAGKGEVIVAKSKNGKTGTVSLAWDAPHASYRNRKWTDDFTGYRPPVPTEDYR